MLAEVFIELDEDRDKLEIPWASPTDPSNRYHNLKLEPQQLDLLPEAAAHPPLRQFLLSVNAPSSLFETAKCDTWETAELTPAEQAAGFAPTKFGSYCDLLFTVPELNFQPQHAKNLAGELSRRLQRFETAQARVELCVRRCLYHSQQAWGYYLTVFTFGYGQRAAEARANWAAALEAVGRALDEIGAILQQALARAERAGQS